jgi:hypothetical protein
LEQRHRRTYEKAMKELKEMQKERKQIETSPKPTGGWAPSPARDPQIALVRSRKLTPEQHENKDQQPETL